MRPIPSGIRAAAASLLLIAVSACARNPVALEDFVWELVSVHDASQVKGHLAERVFRQWDPSRGADRSKAIVLDFTKGLKVGAQYSEAGGVVDEWEVYQDGYWIEKAFDQPVYRFEVRQPTVHRRLPEECMNCIDTQGLIVLVRDFGDADEIQFALVDSVGHLPSPFPVFESWTRFVEDPAGR